MWPTKQFRLIEASSLFQGSAPVTPRGTKVGSLRPPAQWAWLGCAFELGTLWHALQNELGARWVWKAKEVGAHRSAPLHDSGDALLGD